MHTSLAYRWRAFPASPCCWPGCLLALLLTLLMALLLTLPLLKIASMQARNRHEHSPATTDWVTLAIVHTLIAHVGEPLVMWDRQSPREAGHVSKFRYCEHFYRPTERQHIKHPAYDGLARLILAVRSASITVRPSFRQRKAHTATCRMRIAMNVWLL